VGRGLAVYRDSAVSAGNVTRVGRMGGVCPHACRAGKRVKKTSQEFWYRK